MNTRLPSLRPLAVAVSVACLASPLWAQANENESEKESGIEVIEVTATKRITNLMETPVAVSAFTQEAMDRQGIKNVKDIANLVPNLAISLEGSQQAPVISMRGVRSTNVTELGDPAVGIHLDGVYSPRTQGALSLMFDNQRVEVLRGPQGTLFGRNSTVGSINIITNKPDLTGVEGNINLELGRWDARELHGMINIPISDTFAIRAAGKVHERDSYMDVYYDPNQYDQRYLSDEVINAPAIDPADGITNTQTSNWWIDWAGGGDSVRELTKADESDSYGNIDEFAYRISSLWEPSNDLSVNLAYQYYKNKGAGQKETANCEKMEGRPTYDENGDVNGVSDCTTFSPHNNNYTAIVNVPGKSIVDMHMLRGNVNYNVNNDLALVYNFGWENQRRELAQDIENSYDVWDGAMFFLPGTASRSYFHEIQLQSQATSPFSWIVGANLFHEKTTTRGYYDNSINDKTFWSQPDRSSDSYAIFAQGTYDITDKLHLTLGYRYSDEEKEDKGGNNKVCNNDNGCAPGWWARDALNALPADYFEDESIYELGSDNSNKGSWDNHDYRIGLDYDFNDTTMIYASVATGFKAGGIGDVFDWTDELTGEYFRYATSYDPEEVTTYEIGAKSRLLDNKLHLQATYFFQDYDNMQYSSVGTVGYRNRQDPVYDEDGNPTFDDDGNPILEWKQKPEVAYYTQNVPSSEIQGIEVEFEWQAWENGKISGYATWTDTEIVEDWNTKWDFDARYFFGIDYDSSVDPENELLNTNLKGNELAMTPDYTFNLNVEHYFDLGEYGALIPWVNFHWEDEAYLTIWNVDKHTDDMDFVVADEDIHYSDDKRDSYLMINANLRYNAPEEVWYAEAFVQNATDESVQYWSNASQGFNQGTYSSPRYYGIRVGYNFY